MAGAETRRSPPGAGRWSSPSNDPESGPAAAKLAGTPFPGTRPGAHRHRPDPHRAVQLTGSGTDQVEYRDPIAGSWVKLAKVRLPWSVTLPFLVVNRENRAHFEVSGRGSAALFTCTLTVDGERRMSNVDDRLARCEADA